MLTNSEKGTPHTNILLIAITRLGDLLQASPTIVGLRRENPDAHICVLVDQGFAAICRGIPEIDEIYEIDLAMVVRSLHREGDGLVDAYDYLSKLIIDLRARNFDFCLNMASAGYTAMLQKMLDIEDSRGWIADDDGFRLIRNAWSMLFAAYVYHANRDFNSINLVDVIRCSAGVTQHPKRLMYNVAEEHSGFTQEFLAKHGIEKNDGPLICLQAGASQEKRQWAPVRFAKLLQLLVDDLNARVVLTGAKSELPIIQRILQHYNSPRVVSAVGETKLGELGALLKDADLLVTGDTGPMHLSVAVGTPVVALFLASALCYETGPYSAGNIIIQPQITCNPCNPNYACNRPDCHDQVTPELVTYLAKLRMETPLEQEPTLACSPELIDPNQVAVLLSVFDEDNFLDFKRLNTGGERKGYNQRFFSSAREAYRRLWKEEFGQASQSFEPCPAPNGAGNSLKVIDSRDEVSQGLGMLRKLCGEGIAASGRLVDLIQDVNSPPHLLGETNTFVHQINNEIEKVGLTFPVLGALSRMFVMERQNMRGDDPLQLASEMKELFATLDKRSDRFAKLFAHHAERC